MGHQIVKLRPQAHCRAYLNHQSVQHLLYEMEVQDPLLLSYIYVDLLDPISRTCKEIVGLVLWVVRMVTSNQWLGM